MSKFTPGPWKFGKELTAHSGEWLISYDAGDRGQGIAIAETRAATGSELSNARLIAAAPELLAVLMQIQRMGYTDWGDKVMVDEVIAKATGESP